MIIALLISLIFGGPQDYVLIPNMQKHLQKNIDNKETVHFVKNLVKDVNKGKKEFDKMQDKNWRRFEKSKSTNILDYQVYITEIKKARTDLQIVQKEARKKIVNILIEEEWNNIFKSASKDFKKAEKNYLKDLKKLDKLYAKLENSIEKVVNEKPRQDDLLTIVSVYKQQLKEGIKIQYHLYFENEIFWKYDASLENINQTILQANEIKYKHLDLFIESRIKILDNTSKNEQQKIIRRMNSLF